MDFDTLDTENRKLCAVARDVISLRGKLSRADASAMGSSDMDALVELMNQLEFLADASRYALDKARQVYDEAKAAESQRVEDFVNEVW